MKRTIVSEIKKHYTRSGNRVIFKNRMSLNELALEMWDRLGGKSVDTSVLSRILSGERPFTPPQLSVFCDILMLNEEQRFDLEELLAKELLVRHGFSETVILPDMIDLTQKELMKIQKLWLRGDP